MKSRRLAMWWKDRQIHLEGMEVYQLLLLALSGYSPPPQKNTENGHLFGILLYICPLQDVGVGGCWGNSIFCVKL